MRERPSSKVSKAIFRPLTTRNWADLERLFGPRGACAGCWCMWWRLERAKWEKQKGEKNRRAFQKIIATEVPTGVLAYLDQEPVGWCAVAPREHYARLARSRVLRPVDDQPVWSVTCFFVRKEHRRSGLTRQLLQASVQYANKRGAKIIEGYPQDPRRGEMPDAFAYTGFASVFQHAGFEEVARRSATRPVMRLKGND
jgi:GNAT superfamily N-acetyltransferase